MTALVTAVTLGVYLLLAAAVWLGVKTFRSWLRLQGSSRALGRAGAEKPGLDPSMFDEAGQRELSHMWRLFAWTGICFFGSIACMAALSVIDTDAAFR